MENYGYTPIKTIGRGAYGQAVLVSKQSTGQQYVAKGIDMAALSMAERISAENEAVVLRNLEHRNILQYIDSFQTNGKLYIVTEYCAGGDLSHYLKGCAKRGVSLGESQVLLYFLQVCTALGCLHDQKVLHRDLKTENVFLSGDRHEVKLGDFGIATVLKCSAALALTQCGTPFYFSPELCMNKPYNQKSDIWSLGCLLYELMTLKRPFEANNPGALAAQICGGEVKPPPSQYSAELRQLVGLMLNRTPEKRPTIRHLMSMPFLKASMQQILPKQSVYGLTNVLTVTSNKDKDRGGGNSLANGIAGCGLQQPKTEEFPIPQNNTQQLNASASFAVSLPDIQVSSSQITTEAEDDETPTQRERRMQASIMRVQAEMAQYAQGRQQVEERITTQTTQQREPLKVETSQTGGPPPHREEQYQQTPPPKDTKPKIRPKRAHIQHEHQHNLKKNVKSEKSKSFDDVDDCNSPVSEKTPGSLPPKRISIPHALRGIVQSNQVAGGTDEPTSSPKSTPKPKARPAHNGPTSTERTQPVNTNNNNNNNKNAPQQQAPQKDVKDSNREEDRTTNNNKVNVKNNHQPESKDKSIDTPTETNSQPPPHKKPSNLNVQCNPKRSTSESNKEGHHTPHSPPNAGNNRPMKGNRGFKHVLAQHQKMAFVEKECNHDSPSPPVAPLQVHLNFDELQKRATNGKKRPVTSTEKKDGNLQQDVNHICTTPAGTRSNLPLNRRTDEKHKGEKGEKEKGGGGRANRGKQAKAAALAVKEENLKLLENGLPKVMNVVVNGNVQDYPYTTPTAPECGGKDPKAVPGKRRKDLAMLKQNVYQQDPDKLQLDVNQMKMKTADQKPKDVNMNQVKGPPVVGRGRTGLPPGAGGGGGGEGNHSNTPVSEIFAKRKDKETKTPLCGIQKLDDTRPPPPPYAAAVAAATKPNPKFKQQGVEGKKERVRPGGGKDDTTTDNVVVVNTDLNKEPRNRKEGNGCNQKQQGEEEEEGCEGNGPTTNKRQAVSERRVVNSSKVAEVLNRCRVPSRQGAHTQQQPQQHSKDTTATTNHSNSTAVPSKEDKAVICKKGKHNEQPKIAAPTAYTPSSISSPSPTTTRHANIVNNATTKPPTADGVVPSSAITSNIQQQTHSTPRTPTRPQSAASKGQGKGHNYVPSKKELAARYGLNEDGSPRKARNNNRPTSGFGKSKPPTTPQSPPCDLETPDHKKREMEEQAETNHVVVERKATKQKCKASNNNMQFFLGDNILVLPDVAEEDPLTLKVEALRSYLEEKLGFDKLIQYYMDPGSAGTGPYGCLVKQLIVAETRAADEANHPPPPGKKKAKAVKRKAAAR